MRLKTALRVAAAAGLSSIAALAAATAQRTFVASTGVDSNACTRTQPCRTFGRAITQTSAGGEVIVLDSGGYGPVTIAQSVSIVAPPGVYAGITVTFGAGVVVQGAGISVVLRGLTINRVGTPAGIGVDFQVGSELIVENFRIVNMDTGIRLNAVNGHATITRTAFHDHATAGVVAVTGSGVSSATLEDCVFANNPVGVVASSTGGGVRNTLTVTRSTITKGARGLQVFAGPGAVTAIVSNGNTIAEVDFAFSFDQGAGTELIYSPGNNTVGFVTMPASGGSLTPCCAM